MNAKTSYLNRFILMALLASGITILDCQANSTDKPKDNKNQKTNTAASGVSNHALDMFLGNEHFNLTKMFEGRGGRNVLSAQNGNVLIFHKNFVVESSDGGATWSEPLHIGPDVSGYNSIVNEITGEILLVHAPGYIWKTGDHGKTWEREDITILPNSMLHGSPEGIPLVLWAMQPGVTLMHDEHKGRLIMPSRVWGVDENPRVFPWWMFQYSNTLYSDDNGKTWQSSSPFPCVGTGEGAITELSDGSIFYSSRKHYFDLLYPETLRHELHYALSYDGGENWEDLHISKDLPDGPRHRSIEPQGMNFNGHFGLLGGLLRLPVDGRDILLYSNVDTPGHKRERMTVWASFDGGKTWPVSRLVHDGPAAYSSLGVGRAGTSSQGKIYLTFEGGEEDAHDGVHLAVFNLSWLLNGKDIESFIK
jgi:sialidase-1